MSDDLRDSDGKEGWDEERPVASARASAAGLRPLPADLMALLDGDAAEFRDAFVVDVEILPLAPPSDASLAVKGAFGSQKLPTAGLGGAAPAGKGPLGAVASMLAPPPVQVAPGNVRSFDISLGRAGFEGVLRFLMVNDVAMKGPDTDYLAQLFHRDDLLQVKVTLTPALRESPTGAAGKLGGLGSAAGGLGGVMGAAGLPPPATVQVQGLVIERTFREKMAHIAKGAPVILRDYAIRFADPAKVLWRQHYPQELHTKASFKEILELHKGEHINIVYADQTFIKPNDILFFGLDPLAGPAERCSFYDFVMWSLDRANARWIYDYTSKSYVVVGPPLQQVALLTGLMKKAMAASMLIPTPPTGGAKGATGAGAAPSSIPSPGGVFNDKMLYVVDTSQILWQSLPAKPPGLAAAGGAAGKLGAPKLGMGTVALNPREIADVSMYLPETARYQPHILNSYTNDPVRFIIYNRQTALGMRRDYLLSTQLIKEFEERVVNEMERFHIRQPEFLVAYSRFPTHPYMPGETVDFKADPAGWDAVALAIPAEAEKEPCRVFQVDVRGQSVETEAKNLLSDRETAHFRCQLTARLESTSNSYLRLPAFVPPKYPVLVEGQVQAEELIDPQLAEQIRIAAEIAAVRGMSGTGSGGKGGGAKGGATGGAMGGGAMGGGAMGGGAMGGGAGGGLMSTGGPQTGQAPGTPPPDPPDPKAMPGPAYQLFEHPVSMAHQYKVKVPIWNGQVILATQLPIPSPSSMYMPLLAGERVLLALNHHDANILGSLEYRSGVPMPQEGQGSHLMMGKGPNSSTSMQHSYSGGKPVFALGMTHLGSNDGMALQPGKFSMKIGKPGAPAGGPTAPTAPKAPTAPTAPTAPKAPTGPAGTSGSTAPKAPTGPSGSTAPPGPDGSKKPSKPVMGEPPGKGGKNG